MLSRLFCIVILLCNARQAIAEQDVFERQVRPLLIEHCFECHGVGKQESDLRVDSRDALLRGGTSGPAIIPGQPDKSLLLKAVERSGELKMPPKSSLSRVEIDALKQWIQAGAVWPKSDQGAGSQADLPTTHWAFQPLKHSNPPKVSEVSNPIDSFWLERLRSAELEPAETANRETMIRRVTMDLVGLRPTQVEVEAFVSDPDPQAYEKLVDRLLSSNAFGEHWARSWLDLARYSTTKGYVYAREQRQWVHAAHYRDWVIRSLNDDLPYDQFLMMQIAADQVAPDNPSAQAAMGFLTIGRRFLGVARDIIDDRIDVVTRTTMGLTVACARCHDHKYDPISTKDYYSLYGVFLNSYETQVPLVPESTIGEYAKQEELANKVKEAQQLLQKRREETQKRVRERIKDYFLAQFELGKYPFEGFDQIISKDDLLPLFVRRLETYLASAKHRSDPLFVPWHQYVSLPDNEFALRASEVTLAMKKLPAEAVNQKVLESFQDPPKSRQDVADRYAGLFLAAMNDSASKESVDDGLGPFREVLNDPYGPCSIPDESIVNIEYLFDSSTCDELWKRQNEIDNLLLAEGVVPPHGIILKDRRKSVEPQVFRRGNPATAGDFVQPRMLPVVAGDRASVFQQGSGRLELAQAIVSQQNPLTPRVIVNRIWARYFGSGLVRSVSDFGRRADAPSHPELLDWLAQDFMDHGWSLKRLHRTICLSAPYRQGHEGTLDSASRKTALDRDPENRLIWHMPLKRLSLEALLDNVRCAADELSCSSSGTTQDPFDTKQHRRTIYASIDRQFFPNVLRAFDVANPDLHIPLRVETTVPQQALFLLNHPWVLKQAERTAARSDGISDSKTRIRLMYEHLRLPQPTAERVDFLAAWVDGVNRSLPEKTDDPTPWQYGYGVWDPSQHKLSDFKPLPHFKDGAWQGSDAYPDSSLGWLQLTATGGHPGNDLKHAVVRRWIAPETMRVSIHTHFKHEPKQGDGVHAVIYHQASGMHQDMTLHHSERDWNVDEIQITKGEAIDFIVDIGGTLSYDQFLWAIRVAPIDSNRSEQWNAEADFRGPAKEPVDGWTQLAHALLMSNAFVFTD